VDLQKEEKSIKQAAQQHSRSTTQLARCKYAGLLPLLHRLEDRSAGTRFAEELSARSRAQMEAEISAKLILLCEFRQVQALGRAGNLN